MQNSEINIREIRNLTIQGIACQFLPLFILGLLAPQLENLPGSEALKLLIALLVLILFGCGYGICADAADKYAAYKGYKNPLCIYSILNIFGLFILFLLTNKNIISEDDGQEPLNKFSIKYIFTSYLVIPFFIIFFLSIFGFILLGEGFKDYYQNNKNFSTFAEILTAIALTWYFIKEFNQAKINYKHILGSLKRINFKLPIGLAIIEYLFASGLNPIILYGLSSIVPKYVENQINQEYATTLISWILLSITALIYAPIMEELFFRGIIFQKLAIKKGFLNALMISAILFAAIHLRFDIIPLFITGFVSVILYFKTKQLATSIIYHFGYNFVVLIRRLYYQLVSNTDPSIQTTVAEFQQQFSDRFELYILFLAVSTPYLGYFIYKNFPRNYDIEKLPYFANQK